MTEAVAPETTVLPLVGGSVLRKCLCEVFLKSCLKILCGTFYNLFSE